ncbi:hypothetical protein, partial [Salmonella sp. s55004]|uniref:hypothetical protein n=1 Tax=Salmonella sp. s55004 TaxID=3159675 RepID=UPI0039817BDA
TLLYFQVIVPVHGIDIFRIHVRLPAAIIAFHESFQEWVFKMFGFAFLTGWLSVSSGSDIIIPCLGCADYKGQYKSKC